LLQNSLRLARRSRTRGSLPASARAARRDQSCQRPLCVAYKDGREDGYQDGHDDGYEDGYHAGYAAGQATCGK